MDRYRDDRREPRESDFSSARRSRLTSSCVSSLQDSPETLVERSFRRCSSVASMFWRGIANPTERVPSSQEPARSLQWSSTSNDQVPHTLRSSFSAWLFRSPRTAGAAAYAGRCAARPPRRTSVWSSRPRRSDTRAAPSSPTKGVRTVLRRPPRALGEYKNLDMTVHGPNSESRLSSDRRIRHDIVGFAFCSTRPHPTG